MSVGLCQGQHDDQAYRYVIVRLIHGPEGSRCLKHGHADGSLIDMADIRMRNGHVDSPVLRPVGKDCPAQDGLFICILDNALFTEMICHGRQNLPVRHRFVKFPESMIH